MLVSKLSRYRPARRTPDDERGIAMVMTLIVMMVVVVLLLVIFTDNVESMPLARQNQNYQSALQAADAGVQDYINRLDANTAYYLKTTDSSNPAMGGSWAQVCPASSSCAGTAENEFYTYVVNAATAESTGTLWLTVTGAAGCNPSTSGCNPAYRTIKEELSLAANDNSLYYTQYEIEDPNFVSSFTLGAQDSAAYNSYCVYDAWQKNTQLSSGSTTYYGPDTNGSACNFAFINFISADTLNGKIESNDEFNLCGSPSFPYGASSTYNQAVTTAGGSFGGAGAVRTNCTGTPTYGGLTGQPAGSSTISRPLTNSLLKQDLSTGQSGGGCYYQGPITVALNKDGTMSVTLDGSGTSKATATATVSSSVTAEAPVSGTSCVGNSIPYPNNGLIYDDNETTCSTQVCLADVFVSGEDNSGPITIASDNNITITNNIQDASTSNTSSDIVGLWAQSTILLPDSDSQVPGASTTLNQVSSLIVDAAMVSLQDSIYLPCWTTDNGQTLSGTQTNPSSPTCPSGSTPVGTVTGSIPGNSTITDTCGGSAVATPTRATPATLGFLTICGSLSQKFRGPVGTVNTSNSSVSTGYGKNYNWDARLQYLQPPYFNSITTPNWTPLDFEECKATSAPTATTC